MGNYCMGYVGRRGGAEVCGWEEPRWRRRGGVARGGHGMGEWRYKSRDECELGDISNTRAFPFSHKISTQEMHV